MKTTFHYYVMKYYQTQWTDNRMPDKRGTDNRGSTVILFTLGFLRHNQAFDVIITCFDSYDIRSLIIMQKKTWALAH